MRRAEAEKALQLDPELAEAHLTIGGTLLYALDYKEAEKSFRRAIALNSNLSDPHDLLAPCLTAQGRLDEALQEARKAVEVDPLSVGNTADLGLAYYMIRDYRNAELYAQKAMNLDPNFETAHNYMVSVSIAQKQYDRAIEEAKKAVTFGGNNSLDLAFLAWAYGVSGKKEEAKQILQDLNTRAEKEYVSPYFLGLIYLGLGDNQQAITFMQQACRQKDFVATMFYLKADPSFERYPQ